MTNWVSEPPSSTPKEEPASEEAWAALSLWMHVQSRQGTSEHLLGYLTVAKSAVLQHRKTLPADVLHMLRQTLSRTRQELASVQMGQYSIQLILHAGPVPDSSSTPESNESSTGLSTETSQVSQNSEPQESKFIASQKGNCINCGVPYSNHNFECGEFG